MTTLNFDVVIGTTTVRGLTYGQTLALARALDGLCNVVIKGYRGLRLSYWRYDVSRRGLELTGKPK